MKKDATDFPDLESVQSVITNAQFLAFSAN